MKRNEIKIEERSCIKILRNNYNEFEEAISTCTHNKCERNPLSILYKSLITPNAFWNNFSYFLAFVMASNWNKLYGYVSLCCLVARCECTGSSSISWLQFQLLSQCFVEVTRWFRRKFNSTQLATIAKHVVFPDVNKTGYRVTQNKSYQLYLKIKSKLSDSNNLTISGDYSIKCRKTVSTIWINIT